MNKQKILIVDDDENIAELVSLYLTKECFDTMMVHDGERALVAFDTYKPNHSFRSHAAWYRRISGLSRDPYEI